MTSERFCIAARDAVRDIYDSAQVHIKAFKEGPTKAVFAEVLDRSVLQHTRLQQELAQGAGCGIEFAIGEEAVRSTCNLSQCPFYPDGPDAR